MTLNECLMIMKLMALERDIRHVIVVHLMNQEKWINTWHLICHKRTYASVLWYITYVSMFKSIKLAFNVL